MHDYLPISLSALQFIEHYYLTKASA